MIGGGGIQRAKIGVIFPDDGMFPYELADDGLVNRWLGDHQLRGIEYCAVLTPGGKAASIAACEELAADHLLLPAARELRKRNCRAVMWACTSASFMKGPDYAHDQARTLSAAAAAPASSTALAILAAIEALGVKRVDVMLAYTPEVAERMFAFLRRSGIEVGNVWNMSRGDRRAFEIDCREEVAGFVRSFPSEQSPVLIPCTAINSLKIVCDLEEIAGRPVITANLATLWQGVMLAGINPDLRDAGVLFKSNASAGALLRAAT